MPTPCRRSEPNRSGRSKSVDYSTATRHAVDKSLVGPVAFAVPAATSPLDRTWWDLPRTGSVERCEDGLEVRDELVELAGVRLSSVGAARSSVSDSIRSLLSCPASLSQPEGPMRPRARIPSSTAASRTAGEVVDSAEFVRGDAPGEPSPRAITMARRTCLAGECSSRPSMTQVR